MVRLTSDFWKKVVLFLIGLILLSLATLLNWADFLFPDLSLSQSLLSEKSYEKTILMTAILTISIFLLLAYFRISAIAKHIANTILNQRKQLIAIVASLSIFAAAFLPFGGARFLIYYFFAVPGFIFLFLAVWPRASMITTKVGPELSSIFYGMKERNFIILMFSSTFLFTNLISLFVFEHSPHVITGIAHVFHAKIFSAGELFIPSHPLKEFFDAPNDVMINNGKWYTHFPPGHTFMIMLGLLLGIPWIINPLLGSITVVTIYYLGKNIYDEKTARLAALFGLLSPFLIFMSSEFYNHATSLLFATLFILFFVKVVKGGSFSHALFAGLSLGIVINTRLLTAFALSLPFVVYSLWLLVKFKKQYWAKLLVMFFIVMVFVGILLIFNYFTNGSPLVFGYELSNLPMGNQHKIGFQHNETSSFTALDGFVNTVNRLRLLNKLLYEWPIPSLFFVLILFMSMTKDKWDYLLLFSFFSVVVAYFFWFYPGHEFGPRYLYCSVGILVLLTARGILNIPEFIKNVFGIPRSKTKRAIFIGLFLCFFISTSVNYYLWIKFYSSENWRWYKNTNIIPTVKEMNIENAIIFMNPSNGLYRSVFLENSLEIDNSNIIYAKDLGDKNTLLMNYYPNRNYYITDGLEIHKVFNSKK